MQSMSCYSSITLNTVFHLKRTQGTYLIPKHVTGHVLENSAHFNMRKKDHIGSATLFLKNYF